MDLDFVIESLNITIVEKNNLLVELRNRLTDLNKLSNNPIKGTNLKKIHKGIQEINNEILKVEEKLFVTNKIYNQIKEPLICSEQQKCRIQKYIDTNSLTVEDVNMLNRILIRGSYSIIDKNRLKELENDFKSK